MTTDTQSSWLRWMHDPANWANFYNGASLRTFASLAKELWSGQDTVKAVDAAVDDVAENMTRGGIPDDIVAAYREENLRHRDHLVELSKEIGELLPRRGKEPRPPAHPPEPVEEAPYVWLGRTMIEGMLVSLEVTIAGLTSWHHAMRSWSNLLQASPRHRWHGARHRSAVLTHHYGQRVHDVDVERL